MKGGSFFAGIFPSFSPYRYEGLFCCCSNSEKKRKGLHSREENWMNTFGFRAPASGPGIWDFAHLPGKSPHTDRNSLYGFSLEICTCTRVNGEQVRGRFFGFWNFSEPRTEINIIICRQNFNCNEFLGFEKNKNTWPRKTKFG